MNRTTRGLVFCMAVVVSSLSMKVRAADSLQPRQWNVEGETRDALVYIPESAKEKAAPIVFAFHGHGGNSRNAARTFPIHTLWPEAISVYMQGLNTPGRLTDPEGKKPGWQSAAGDQKDRDLKFFDAVLKSLHEDAKVDDKRVYATGHSNGGGFSYLLAAQRGDKLAAIAPSAALAVRARADFKPIPVLHLAGRNDPLVKFEWQKSMIDNLKKLNQCEGEPYKWAEDKCEVFPSKTNTPVVTMIHDGTHAFPKDGAAIIVKFFKEFGKRE